MRGGSGARRDRHRRHRAGAHREGRRLPAGGDGSRGLSRDLPHGGDPRGRHLLPEVPPGKDSVNLDSQVEGRLQRAGYIVGRLQRVIFQDPASRTPTGARPRRSPARWAQRRGLPALLQGRSALDQLAGPDLRRDAAGHWRRVAPLGHLGAERSGWTPTASSGWRRAPRVAPGVVGGPSTVRGGQPADRQHGPEGRRVHLQELNLSIDDIKDVGTWCRSFL